MLNQINSETNKLNETPSTILDVVVVETCNFGEIVTVIRPITYFKLLRGSLINELKVTVMDEYGKAINNYGQPITVVLQILENEHLWRISYHRRC